MKKKKKVILHADDGSVYKISHGDLQSFKVPDDHPQPVSYRDLAEKSKRGDWGGMSQLVTDEMLDVYAVSGSWEEIPEKIERRYRGILERVGLYLPFVPGQHDARWRALNEAFAR